MSQKYHHCAATPEWVLNGQMEIQMTLCGLESLGGLWVSLPDRFMERPKGFLVEYPEPVPPKCPDCLAHPDLPLLLLGRL